MWNGPPGTPTFGPEISLVGGTSGRPPMMRNSAHRSAGVPASGPGQSSEGARGSIPSMDRSPVVGLRPNVPHMDAGMRMDPPVSEPSDQGTTPAAAAAAEPPLEPPV